MRGLFLFLLVISPVVAGGVSCGGGKSSVATPVPVASVTPAKGGGEEMTIELTSSAFVAGGAIPAKYTCNGEGTSPPLQWTSPPAGAQSLALDRRRPRCAERHIRPLGDLRSPAGCARSAGGRADGWESRRRQLQREERRQQARLHGPLPAQRHASLPLQALRPRRQARTRRPAGARTNCSPPCRATSWPRRSSSGYTASSDGAKAGQRPVNAGGRFSRKELTPSLKSCDPNRGRSCR